jgi:hypothetical protein
MRASEPVNLNRPGDTGRYTIMAWHGIRDDPSPRHRTRIARRKPGAGRRVGVVEEKSRSDVAQHANAAPIEHRNTARRRSLRGGKIVFNQRSSVISCSIVNMSETGACLEAQSTIGIPKLFELKFEPGGEWRVCQVAWRNQRRIGVTFD